jgi:hypothetical protein
MRTNQTNIKEIEEISIFSLKNLGMSVIYPQEKLIISKKIKKL